MQVFAYRCGNGMSSLGSHWRSHQERQGWAASFTIPTGSRAARDTRQHQPQILDASQGMRLGRGWAHLSKAHSPWLGRAGLWEAGFQLCCGILGQGLMAPRDWWGVLCSGQDEGEISGKLGRDESWTVSSLWAFKLHFGFCSSARSSHNDRWRIANSIITHTAFTKGRMDMWATWTDSRCASSRRK